MPSRITQRIDQVSTGAIALTVDANNLTSVTGVTTDYMIIQDVTDDSTKKALISDVVTAGDITGITTAANSGMAGGATSGTPSLSIDASNLTALGATVATGDYVVIYDTDGSATKKVLVSNMPGLWA